MPFGYTGRILHVDLQAGTFRVEEPPEAFYRAYMGGASWGLSYLLARTPASPDPLAPESLVTLMLSVMTGTPISGQSRLTVTARSPLTGAIGDSQSGGFFPAELKFAGFDGIVIGGRAPRPVYLSVLDGRPALHDAAPLAGRTTGEAGQLIAAELGDPRIEVLQHGPAAERGVLFSSLVSMANRNNGRNGLGLVLASKNLRAIAVRGRQRPPVADPRALAALHKAGPRLVPDNPDMDDLGRHGTSGLVRAQNDMGTLPAFNYREGQFAACDDIGGQRLAATYLTGRDTCYGCVIRCKRVVEVGGSRPVDPAYGGPEYETVSTFGSYCGISDPRGDLQGERDLQRVRRGHDQLRRHDRVRDGVRGTRHHRPGGNRRPRSAVRERGGDDRGAAGRS